MPASNDIISYVKRAIANAKPKMPTSAIVIGVDGNLADIRLQGHSTNLANCRIAGDPLSIVVGMLVSIVWEDYNGVPRPVVQGPGGTGVNISATGTPGSTLTDNETIENSSFGLRVKMGGITPAHLSFDPFGGNTAIGDILPGWTVTDDGILVGGDLTFNPRGEITVGYDPDIVKISNVDATFRIWAGSSTPASAPFSVSKTGHLISSAATIAGWEITSTQIKKTGIILDSSADAIYVGLIAGDHIVLDGGNEILKSSNFDAGVSGFGLYASDGDAEFNNVVVRGTLRASVFNIGEITATAGSQGVFKSAAEVWQDVTTPGTVSSAFTLRLKNSDTGAVLGQDNDVIRIKSWNGSIITDVWGTIDGTPSNLVTHAVYNINLESGTTVDLKKGMACVMYGPSDQGFIIMSADDTVGYSANLSIVDFKTGVPATWSVEDGGLGYGVGNILTVTGGDGEFDLEVLTISGSTVLTVGPVTDQAGKNHTIGIKATTVSPPIGTGCEIEILTIDGPWSNTQRLMTRIGNMRGSYGAGANERYGFGVGDYASGNYMSYNAEVENTFKIKIGDDAITMDEDGIALTADTLDEYPVSNLYNRIRWLNGADEVGYLGTSVYNGWVTNRLWSDTHLMNINSGVVIGANGKAGYDTQVALQVYNYGEAGLAWIIPLYDASDDMYRVEMGASSGIVKSFSTFQVTGAGTPVTQKGVEISWEGSYGRVMAYGRDGTADQPLQLRGSYIDFNESGTARFRIDGAHIYRNTGGYVRVSTVVWDIIGAISGWTGGGRSSSSGTLTEAQLGIPENATSVFVRIIARDSGAWPQDLYFGVGPTATNFAQVACYPPGASSPVTNGLLSSNSGFAALSGGTLNYGINASGSLTMDCWIEVYGYTM